MAQADPPLAHLVVTGLSSIDQGQILAALAPLANEGADMIVRPLLVRPDPARSLFEVHLVSPLAGQRLADTVVAALVGSCANEYQGGAIQVDVIEPASCHVKASSNRIDLWARSVAATTYVAEGLAVSLVYRGAGTEGPAATHPHGTPLMHLVLADAEGQELAATVSGFRVGWPNPESYVRAMHAIFLPLRDTPEALKQGLVTMARARGLNDIETYGALLAAAP